MTNGSRCRLSTLSATSVCRHSRMASEYEVSSTYALPCMYRRAYTSRPMTSRFAPASTALRSTIRALLGVPTLTWNLVSIWSYLLNDMISMLPSEGSSTLSSHRNGARRASLGPIRGNSSMGGLFRRNANPLTWYLLTNLLSSPAEKVSVQGLSRPPVRQCPSDATHIQRLMARRLRLPLSNPYRRSKPNVAE